MPKILQREVKEEKDLIDSIVYSTNCFVQGTGLGTIAIELENNTVAQVPCNLSGEIEYTMWKVV